MQFKKSLLTILLILTLILVTGYGVNAQSQTAMNIEAGNGYQKADKELNIV